MHDAPSLALWLKHFQLATATQAAVIFWRDTQPYGDSKLSRCLEKFRPPRTFSCATEVPPGGELPAVSIPPAEGTGGWACPIHMHGTVLGIAGVAAPRRPARYLQAQARLLATGVAFLVREAAGEEERRRTLGWVQALAAPGEGAAAHVPESVYASFLASAVQVVGANSGSLMLVNPVSGLPDLVSSVGLRQEAWQSAAAPLVAAAVAREGRATLFGDLRLDPRFASIMPRSDVHSSICIPLKYGGKVRAVLSLNRKEEPGFASADLDRVCAWAGENSAIIRIAGQLFGLKQKEAELAVIKALDNSRVEPGSDSTADLEQILSQMAAAVRVPVALLRVVRRDHSVFLAFPPGGDDARQRDLLDAMARSLEAGSPLIEGDLSQGRRRLPADVALPAGCRSCLAVLLRTAEARAVLAVLDDRPRRFAQGEPQFLAMAAEYVAAEGELARVRRVLDTQHKAILELSAKVVQAQEEERRRLALELHDEISQSLSSLLFRIQTLEHLLTPELPRVQEEVREVLLSTRHVLDSVISIMYRLRPAVLDRYGLFVALRQLVRHFMRETGIQVSLQVSGRERRLSADVELAVYRVVQESLHNVRKHSGAQDVYIPIDVRDQSIEGIVEDNGRGFDHSVLAPGDGQGQQVGLTGMRERARNLGGTLRITTGAGQRGTAVHFFIPLGPVKRYGAQRGPEHVGPGDHRRRPPTAPPVAGAHAADERPGPGSGRSRQRGRGAGLD